MGLHFAETHHLTHDLGLEAGRFGLGIDLADIPGDGRFLLLQALDALDEGLQSVRRNATSIRHKSTPPIRKRSAPTRETAATLVPRHRGEQAPNRSEERRVGKEWRSRK